jgi:hypothetical protein
MRSSRPQRKRAAAVRHADDDRSIAILAKHGLSPPSLNLPRLIAEGSLLGEVTHGQLLDDRSRLDPGDLRELARKRWIAGYTKQIAGGNVRRFVVAGLAQDARRRLHDVEAMLIASGAAGESFARSVAETARREWAWVSAARSALVGWIGHIFQSLLLLAGLLAVGMLLF